MKSTVAQCAAAIRAELKVAFPGTKFTVRSESFAGGNAVDIRYLDGPKREDVCSITDKYQYGSFDGMTDSYNVDNKNENLPQAKFVQVERRATEETKAAIAKEFGISDDQLNDWNDRFQCYNTEFIYRMFVQRDYSDRTEDHADVMGSFNEDGDTAFPSYTAGIETEQAPGPGQSTETPLTGEGDGIPGVSMVVISEGADVDLVTRLFDNSGTGNAVLLTSVPTFNPGEPDQVFPSFSVIPNKKVPMYPDATPFKNDDTDREKLLTGKWVDTSVQYPNQVTFDKVYAQYRGGQILRVAEVYANGDWRPTSEFFTEIEFEIWAPAEMIQRLVDAKGAEIFCLEIEDEFGRIKNPDFRTNELFPG